MGLNIYFCDVCGVRVTDVDLRSGHGMLRGQDVICATCLEMGHGKEWLASRGIGSEALALAGAPARSASSGSGRTRAAAAMLDSARDRAATFDDKIRLQQSAAPSDSGRRAALDLDDTKAVPVVHEHETDFSNAASGLAALATLTPLPTDMDDEASLEENPSDLQVAAAPRPRRPKGKTSDEHLASPFEPADDDESSALINVKEQTSSSRISAQGRSDRQRKPSTSRSVPSISGRSAGKRSSGSGPKASERSGSSKSASSKSSSTKISKGKSSTRSSRRGSAGGGMPMPLKISLFTVPVILLIALVFLFAPSGSREPDLKDIKAQKDRIDRSFSEAKTLVNGAVSSKDLSEMKAARERWFKFQEEWSKFTNDAKQYSGWSDDSCDQYWESIQAHDVQGRLKILNDEIAKQSFGH